jgi:acyl carrier protein
LITKGNETSLNITKKGRKMQKKLIEYIRESIGISEEINASSKILSTGLLDSVAMVQLIMYIEETAGIQILPQEVTLDNFDTISYIVNYIEQKS